MKKFPILFSAESTIFTTNGIGVLSDAVSCKVTEELNGVYELEMQYPAAGKYFNEIKEREIIYAKPNISDDMQPFRIYRISSPMNGNVKIYAEHISYDLNGIQVSPFLAVNVVDAMEKIKSYSATDNPFTFTTDKATVADMNITTPRSVRNCLGGQENSILEVYTGDFKFDGYTVSLLAHRGEDTGMSIRYGVNLTDINQDKNISKLYTGIYPYYYWAEDGKFLELPEKILNADGDFGFTRIASVDLTSYFDNHPTVDELREQANKYLIDNLNTEISVDITVKFEQLKQYEEYKDIAFLELLSLGDTVKVIFPNLNISTSARCIKTIYDAILHKYISVTLGRYRSKITDTISTLENVVRQSESKIGAQGRAIARIELASDDYGAQISAITEWIGDESSGATQTIAQLTQEVNSQGAKIGLLVQTDSEGNNSVKGSVVIEAINGESTATISADRIDLSGYVSISNLESGTTVIDGSWINTGTLNVSDGATIGGWSITSNKMQAYFEDTSTTNNTWYRVLQNSELNSDNPYPAYTTVFEVQKKENATSGFTDGDPVFYIRPTGEIHAELGDIAGFTISQSSLTKSMRTVDATRYTIDKTEISENGFILSRKIYDDNDTLLTSQSTEISPTSIIRTYENIPLASTVLMYVKIDSDTYIVYIDADTMLVKAMKFTSS